MRDERRSGAMSETLVCKQSAAAQLAAMALRFVVDLC